LSHAATLGTIGGASSSINDGLLDGGDTVRQVGAIPPMSVALQLRNMARLPPLFASSYRDYV